MDQESAQQYANANQAAIQAIDTIIKQNNIECDFSAACLCLHPGR